jgi:hypothetical protein
MGKVKQVEIEYRKERISKYVLPLHPALGGSTFCVTSTSFLGGDVGCSVALSAIGFFFYEINFSKNRIVLRNCTRFFEVSSFDNPGF